MPLNANNNLAMKPAGGQPSTVASNLAERTWAGQHRHEDLGRNDTPPPSFRSKSHVLRHESNSELGKSAGTGHGVAALQSMKLPFKNSFSHAQHAVDVKKREPRGQESSTDQNRKQRQASDHTIHGGFDDTGPIEYDDSITQQEDQTTVVRGPGFTGPLQDEGTHLVSAPQRIIKESAQKMEESVAPHIVFGERERRQVESERDLRRMRAPGRTNLGPIASHTTAARHNAREIARISAPADLFDAVQDTPTRIQPHPPHLGPFKQHNKAVAFHPLPLASGDEESLSKRDEKHFPESQQDEISIPETQYHPDQIQDQLHKDGLKSGSRQLLSRQANDQTPKQGDGKPQDDQTKHSMFQTSRESDYPTSSEDDLPPSDSRLPSPISTDFGQQDLTTRKRKHNYELDHDQGTLKGMSFDQLQQEDYNRTIFPQSKVSDRSPVAEVDHTNQLTNLNQMNKEDQMALFKTQNEEEWASTGTWFVQKFQRDLQRLFEVRLERRKLSLRFEHEIRKRQQAVERSTSGVEEELKVLKKGGGELIEGKTCGSRTSTPHR